MGLRCGFQSRCWRPLANGIQCIADCELSCHCSICVLKFSLRQAGKADCCIWRSNFHWERSADFEFKTALEGEIRIKFW